jgi:cytoplasmic iron level regulating protein YaaA (DUF328/UPF0246 family)
MKARAELATLIGYSPGPDLGFDIHTTNLEYLPACLRYSGIIYRRSNLRDLYPKIKEKRITIISALYGLLDAEDDIRNYDLKMDESLPNGQRLYTWWKQQGLGEILCEYVRNLSPVKTHDILSGNYRKATSPWSRRISSSDRIIYNYPYEGNGSNNHRGRDLENLLYES